MAKTPDKIWMNGKPKKVPSMLKPNAWEALKTALTSIAFSVGAYGFYAKGEVLMALLFSFLAILFLAHPIAWITDIWWPQKRNGEWHVANNLRKIVIVDNYAVAEMFARSFGGIAPRQENLNSALKDFGEGKNDLLVLHVGMRDLIKPREYQKDGVTEIFDLTANSDKADARHLYARITRFRDPNYVGY